MGALLWYMAPHFTVPLHTPPDYSTRMTTSRYIPAVLALLLGAATSHAEDTIFSTTRSALS